MTQPLLTAPEAAAYLRLSVASVTRLAREGKINSRRPGQSYLFTQSDLDRYLNGSR